MGKKDKTVHAKGPSAVASSTSTGASTAVGDGSLAGPSRLQQQVLDIFKNSCAIDGNTQVVVQQVKQHLYNREFSQAFGSEPNLWAYAARWSPSRALAYLQIFSDISSHITDATQSRPEDDVEEVQRVVPPGQAPSSVPQANTAVPPTYGPMRPPPSSVKVGDKYEIVVLPPAYDADQAVPQYENPPAYGTNVDMTTSVEKSSAAFRITCLGGGAGAELVAAAAWLRLQSEESDAPERYTGQATVDADSLEVYCVDVADWHPVVSALDNMIKTPPPISAYAAAAKKAANVALLPRDTMRSEFIRQDLLDANLDCFRSLCLCSGLITIMFTLNELYSISVAKTQRLLFEITVATRPGTMLLVVDSPGSYSTVKLNGAEKKYPMHWLLDHTLLEASKNTRILPRRDHWEKVLTDESRWFRLPKGLEYPIELENMRYQIHLYRRLGVADDHDAQDRRLAS